MATNKVSFTKLGIKTVHKMVEINWNGQKIEVLTYLPIEQKLNLISRIINQSIDDNNFANPARLNVFTVLEIMYGYTNIIFTTKQRENFLGLYDAIVSSGLWHAVFEIIKEAGEYDYIQLTTADAINEIYKYRDSLLGILQSVKDDYENLDLDASKIQQKLTDRENVEFLTDVVTKLGGGISPLEEPPLEPNPEGLTENH